jgi:hypothetical protein
MSSIPLPTDDNGRNELHEHASNLAARSWAVVRLLRDAEQRPGSVPPATVLALPGGAGGALTWTGASPAFQVNAEVRGVAVLANKVLPHLGLDTVEEGYVCRLAASAGGESGGRAQDTDLLLAGVLQWEGEAIPADVRNADRLRLVGLVRVFEKVSEAADALSRRLQRVMHPPTVQDRVTVDLVKCVVTVDGIPVNVRDNHATLFHHLVAANGRPVSGCDIAKQTGEKEFKVGRFVSQIKKSYPCLGKILKQEKGTNGRYCIELPPLP